MAFCDVAKRRDSVVRLVQGDVTQLQLEQAGRLRVFNLHQQVRGVLASVAPGQHFNDAHTSALEVERLELVYIFDLREAFDV